MQRLFGLLTSRIGFDESVSVFDRLSMIRFPLILLIVFFHNDRGGEFSSRLEDSPAAASLIHILAYGFGGIRVPTFFLIAGYIFFRSVRPTTAWFRAKLDSRARSLLVPLVLWNLLGLATLALAQQIPFIAPFLNAKSGWGGAPVIHYTAQQFLEAIVGSVDAQPLIFPLWFLRDLFILVLFTPAIYWSIKASGGWITLVVALGWSLGVDPYLVAEDALFFFFVGCHLAVARRSIFLFDSVGWVAGLGWLILQIAESYQLTGLPSHKLKALFGVVAVLYISGWLAQWPVAFKFMTKGARYSFFIFVAHEPLLTLIRRAYLKVVQPTTAFELLSGYFLIVFLVIGVLVAAFKLGERTFPQLLALMTGGRSA